MAKVLLIKKADLIAFTQANGNIDSDKLMQHIAVAQDINLQSLLGTDLLEKLQADVSGSTLSGNYLTLMQEYVKPVLIHWSMVEAIPMLALTIGNGGIYRHEPENGTSLDASEIRDLVNAEKKRAVYYSDRLIEYLNHNSNLFPEYTSNTNEDVSPRKNSNFVRWNL